MNAQFLTGLAARDLLRKHPQSSLESLCALAAFTKAQPGVALQSIRRCLSASGHEYPESEIEKHLIAAYVHQGAKEQDHLANAGTADAKRLIELSPVPPHQLQPGDFFRKLYHPDQHVVLYDGESPISVWNHATPDETIPVYAKLSVRFWPLPHRNGQQEHRTPQSAEALSFAVVKGMKITEVKEALTRQFPIVAVVTTRLGRLSVIVRAREGLHTWTDWSEEGKRILRSIPVAYASVYRLDHLVPLPGTISRYGLHRLLYFNPEAPSVA